MKQKIILNLDLTPSLMDELEGGLFNDLEFNYSILWGQIKDQVESQLSEFLEQSDQDEAIATSVSDFFKSEGVDNIEVV